MERPEATKAHEEAKEQLDKIASLNRRNRRTMLRKQHSLRNRPFARVTSGTPTGTTPHFRLWKADLLSHSILQGLKLDKLADDIEDAKVAGGMALLYLGGVKNVADLKRRKVEDLLAIDRIGLDRLEAVETYLRERNVALNWTTA